MEEINLKEFFDYYKKYVLIVLSVILFSIAGILIYNVFFKVPVYTTSTTVVLVKNESLNENNNNTIDQNDITLNQKLVSTYRQIIKSKLVLNQVIRELDLDYSYEKIYSEVSVKAEDDTEILRITVTDSDAKRSKNIANMIARVFDKEVTQIYNINNVSVIDIAEIPDKPSNNNLIRDIILAILVSFVASSAVIFVIYYFDDTLRDIDSIESEMKVGLLSKIYKGEEGDDLAVENKPNSLASESIRTLRTNLLFSAVDEELKTILVTSSIPGEGKSFITANLAASFAQNGKKVVIVDCDLRKGRQHKIFGASSKIGLSGLLLNDIKHYKNYLVNTKVKNLDLIPRGVLPPNPSELLNSKKNEALIKELSKDYDIVLLDGAPIAGLSDSLIISSLVDKTILVSAINSTPKTELKNAIKSLENIGAHLAGIVINKVQARKNSHGGYYYYYSSDKEE